MICFAGFTPHSPLLIETIGKKNLKYLAKTRQAISVLANELKQSNPEVIFVIAAHSLVHEKAFSINLHNAYATDFQEFGDHATTESFEPNLELISAIQKTARQADIPFVLESRPSLDYGSAVPLFLLCQQIKCKLVPISYSGSDRKQHISFGRILKEVVLLSDKRIAVIASGDLAHTLSSDAPMGYRKEGKVFDDAVKRSIEQFSTSNLLTINDKTVERAEQCALRSLLILFGMLEKIHVRPEILSYEAPFGVGYLVAQFHL